MVPFPARIPQVIRHVLRKKYVWHKVPNKGKCLYLTFDDGPIPEITPWVLDLLKNEGVHATFFCVGENVVNHAAIYDRIKSEGHTVGNHSYNHVNGWKTSKEEYLHNYQLGKQTVNSHLFRPPYGKITRAQAMQIAQQDSIIMWSVLTKDYSSSETPQMCLTNAFKCRNGDIVVFHDNIKAKKNLYYVLPKFIRHYKALGYRFATL